MTQTASVLADVSRETLERLEIYQRLLSSWTGRINLISPKTVPEIWQRHIEDCAQLAPDMPKTARSYLDCGTGGGLPGLVLAAIGRESHPDMKVHLAESDHRKSVFLDVAAREMGLEVQIHTSRIESLPDQQFDVITARALAPLPRLLPLISRFMGSESVTILQKGARLDSELTEAKRGWHISFEQRSSATDPSGRILLISKVERKV